MLTVSLTLLVAVVSSVYLLFLGQTIDEWFVLVTVLLLSSLVKYLFNILDLLSPWQEQGKVLLKEIQTTVLRVRKESQLFLPLQTQSNRNFFSRSFRLFLFELLHLVFCLVMFGCVVVVGIRFFWAGQYWISLAGYGSGILLNSFFLCLLAKTLLWADQPE